MDSEFWHERWNANQIAFHQGRPNAMLERHFAALGLAPLARVLVPLCGKATDMTWLRRHGHEVLGVELSPIAVRDYFRDQHEPYAVSERDTFEVITSERIEILRGDFFATKAANIGEGAIQGVYDRAALVALPEQMRARYVAHLLDLVGPDIPILLITFDYQQAQMQGPPFSVPEALVRTLFEPHRSVTLLEREEVLDRAPELKQRGLTQLAEAAFMIV
jgi:thiopurine S-methyltransferase